MAAESYRRLVDKLQRDLGPVATGALQDPATVELMLNPDGRLWQERLGQPMRCIGQMGAQHAEGVIRTLAAHLQCEVTPQRPMIEGELPPHGYRFAGQLPPVVTAPTFCIRKPAVTALSLSDYVRDAVLSEGAHQILATAVAERRNILVVGATGSGKTTLCGALLTAIAERFSDDRVVVLQDTLELPPAAENTVMLRTTAEVSMTALLRTTLRMRPDRILVGEVRGPEALDMLMAWSTGHEGGVATLHAGDPRAALLRLQMLVSMHPHAPKCIEALIADAVDLVVLICRTPAGRRVRKILAVEGLGPDGYRTTDLYLQGKETR